MKSISERLTEIKEQIEKSKTEKAQLEGKLSSQHEALKKLGISKIEDAQKELKKLKEKIDNLAKDIEKSMTDFTKKYGF